MREHKSKYGEDMDEIDVDTTPIGFRMIPFKWTIVSKYSDTAIQQYQQTSYRHFVLTVGGDGSFEIGGWNR